MVFPLGWIPSDAAKPRWTPGYALPDTNAADVATLDVFTRAAGAIGIPADASHTHPILHSVAVVQGSASQSFASATTTAIVFGGGYLIQAGSFLTWNAGQPTRLTCQRTGTYFFWSAFEYAPSGAGVVRSAFIGKNGVTPTTGGFNNRTPFGTYANEIQISIITIANSGDYYEVLGYQDSGVPLNINDTYFPIFGGIALGVLS